MTGRLGIGKRAWQIIALLVLLVLLVVAGYIGYNRVTNTRLTAYFATTTGLYNGDPVRVLGVNVGHVTSITPRSGDVKVEMDVDRSVKIPADARAVVVAQSLVSGRFIQLTPVYSSGPQMTDGTDIPMERTAVPMEWDQVKQQLQRLTDAVGPNGADPGAAARAIDVGAQNLDGAGQSINSSITQLSDVMGTLASGRDDLFTTIRNLQKLTDALSSSHEQMVQFNGRIASVTSVLADNTDQLNGALHNLDSAMTDVQNFINTNQNSLTGAVSRLAQTTGILAAKDEQMRGLLHSAPNQLANFYNIYNPLTGSLSGVFGLGMGNNLITLLCGTMEANNRPGQSQVDIDKCVDTLAPVLQSIVVAYPPFMSNPVNGINATPGQVTYQNADVAARAQQGIRNQDAATRRADGGGPLADLLVPWGGAG
ncbi:putative virulence factor, Mce family protein [Gordonia polyisoprenivorans VH2]|uniref:Putative virulence factor, Mce family protein n=1 Tax=Gordonia polyisoprenivorans (strain DSM 44266 / VH2) TaxID=1112204 RepID=H6MUS1_GORPV|nr:MULTISPECIES: MCE family protein [Gordonia]AFA75262.1 putative virulence factor, Mce family protein [Gordonia polyisoprenivorans VH2]MDF3284179.1 MCE family protein [Gordonia sp. N1V]UZF55580.1 MCE family protein [Gordonia polyisoprenivorans]WCB36724.1 MCE family protein [Gordonia polyisoprenivorans]